MKVIMNPDEEYVKEIKDGLKDNNGYCPCRLIHIQKYKCMCEEFREMIKNNQPGTCHCGLYILVEEEGE